MAKISADIAKTVDLTVRRGDSFYLKIVLTNDDGTAYDIMEVVDNINYQADLKVYNNDELVLGFSSAADQATPIISSSISVTGSTATLVVSTSSTNMGLYTGTYKYKLYVSSDTDSETNTVLVGKFKVVDI